MERWCVIENIKWENSVASSFDCHVVSSNVSLWLFLYASIICEVSGGGDASQECPPLKTHAPEALTFRQKSFCWSDILNKYSE